IAARRPGEPQGQLRRGEERPGPADRDAHLALHARQPREPRAGARPQAAPPSERDREAPRANRGEGTDRRPAPPLFQRKQGEGGDRRRPRQKTVRQARDREAPRSRPRNRRREEDDPIVWSPSHTAGVTTPQFPRSTPQRLNA